MQHADAKPGDLHQMQSVEYTIKSGGCEVVEVDRNLTYTLRDSAQQVIYDVQEQEDVSSLHEHASPTYEQPDFDSIKAIIDRKHPDRKEQAEFDEHFSDLFDGVGNIELFTEILDFRNAEAALCVLTLVKEIKARRTMPDVINQPNDAYTTG